MEDIKYALIGCGRISKNHISAAITNNLKISALCDIDSSRMDNIDAKESVKYSDYIEMLEKEKPNLIAIATESGKHAKIAIDCIRRGANVIIEKPIALSIADADNIISEGKRNNVKVCVCHQNRFNKSIQKVRGALEGGALGKLMHASAVIRWNRNRDYYEQAKWRGTWEQDGGALMNQCIHNIDLLRWMMGDEVSEVFAYTDKLMHDYIEAEDLGVAVIKFANGSYGLLEGTTNIYPSNYEETLCLFGTDGTVKIGGKSVNTIEHWVVKNSVENAESLKKEFTEIAPDVYGFGHTPLYRDMILSIKENKKPYVDAVAGRNAMELVLAIYKSARDGKPIKLPLGRCGTMDFGRNTL